MFAKRACDLFPLVPWSRRMVEVDEKPLVVPGIYIHRASNRYDVYRRQIRASSASLSEPSTSSSPLHYHLFHLLRLQKARNPLWFPGVVLSAQDSALGQSGGWSSMNRNGQVPTLFPLLTPSSFHSSQQPSCFLSLALFFRLKARVCHSNRVAKYIYSRGHDHLGSTLYRPSSFKSISEWVLSDEIAILNVLLLYVVNFIRKFSEKGWERRRDPMFLCIFSYKLYFILSFLIFPFLYV